MNEQHPAGAPQAAPVANEKRPLGVTLLACVAFSATAVLVKAAISWIILLFREHRENPQAQDLPAYIGVTITLLSTVTLAIISFVAGVDLLRLRKRGRSLTIVSMILTCLLGALFVVVEILDHMGDKQFLWAGLAICTLSVLALLYLYRPKVRQRFAMTPPAKID